MEDMGGQERVDKILGVEEMADFRVSDRFGRPGSLETLERAQRYLKGDGKANVRGMDTYFVFVYPHIRRIWW